MKQAAKLVIVDNNATYLLLYRSNHPVFGSDPDLPGGTLEEGESTLETMIREVEEEAGIRITPEETKEVYAGTEYAKDGTNYVLYVAKLTERPAITISWEHSSYVWVTRDELIHKAKTANDTFMHMVSDVLARAQV